MQDAPKSPNPTPQDPLPFLGRRRGGKAETTTSAKRRPSRRIGRYLPWFVTAFVGSCILGGVAAYVAKNNGGPTPSPLIELPLLDIASSSDEKAARDKVRREPPPATFPPPLMSVDSYATEHFRSLKDWPQVSGAYGFVDVVAIGGDNPGQLTSRRLSNDDVLAVSGWAGHQKLGMTMEHVVFALCDQIVGSVPVNTPRPDVAKAVHPYLDKSGWSAQLAVTHLPRCEDAQLMAYGLAFKGPNLWPLSQNTVLALPRRGEIKTAKFASRAPVHDPLVRLTPKARNVTVQASALRVRSCGGSKCEVLGRVSKGVYKGYIVERRDGWTLIQFPAVSGWVSEKHIFIDG